MEDESEQSFLQIVFVVAILLAVVIAGLTYVTEGAVNWRTVWVFVFLVTLPGVIHVYLEQQ